MKFFLKKDNILTLLFVLIVIYTQGPTVMNNLKLEGTEVHQSEFIDIKTGEKKFFPPQVGNSIVIFWATWCGPCKLEMNRLKNSVKEGKIPKDRIFAINPFESKDSYKEFLKKESYPFTFIDYPGFSEKLNITKTPTTLFLNEKKISSMSSGLSFIGIWRAENHVSSGTP